MVLRGKKAREKLSTQENLWKFGKKSKNLWYLNEECFLLPYSNFDRVETPLQTSATKTQGSLAPQCTEGLFSAKLQDGSISRSVHSYLLLRLSSRWVWLKSKAPFCHPAPISGMEVLPWALHAKTVTLVTLAPACEVVVPCHKIQAERSCGCLYFSTKCSALRVSLSRRNCHCSQPQLQSPSSDILLENGVGKRGKSRLYEKKNTKNIVLIFSQRNWIFATIFGENEAEWCTQKQWKLCEKQLGEDSRYRLNWNAASLQAKTQNKSSWRNSLEVRKSIKHWPQKLFLQRSHIWLD